MIYATATSTSRRGTGGGPRPRSTARSARRPARSRRGLRQARAAIYIILKDYKGGLDFIAKAKAWSAALAECSGAGRARAALLLWESDHKRDEAIKIAEQVVATQAHRVHEPEDHRRVLRDSRPREDAGRLRGLPAAPAGRARGRRCAAARGPLGFGRTSAVARQPRLPERDEARAAAAVHGKAVDQFDTVAAQVRQEVERPGQRRQRASCAAYTGLGRFDQAASSRCANG